MFSIARTINSGDTNSCFSCSVNVRFSYVGRTFCPVLMRCTSVFIWSKSVTRTVISVNRLFIIRYTSGLRAFFPVTCPVLVRSLLDF